MNKPSWMSDPTIAHIPQEKLDFLSQMFEKVKGKNKNELMPFLMAMHSKVKGNVKFTAEEMQLIVAAIKRTSSSEEQAQIDKVLNMAHSKAKKQGSFSRPLIYYFTTIFTILPFTQISFTIFLPSIAALTDATSFAFARAFSLFSSTANSTRPFTLPLI